MPDSSATASHWWLGGLALLALAALLARLPGLSDPLLEGAAGKQTHTAMVARNLYRGRATLARPRVDDVGPPGYFVKELPVVPALGAALYGLAGGVDERFLRLIGWTSWLAGVPLLAGLLRRPLGDRSAWLAALWGVVSPMAWVYGRAAMNDPLVVTASLAALWALLRWRESPGPAAAVGAGVLIGVAFLLKPHSAFWIGPAALVCLGPGEDGTRPPLRASAWLVAAAGTGLALASLWYLHAAAIHRAHPVPGATVAGGWVAPALLGRPGLWTEIGRQSLLMVFTPLGAAVALLGATRGPRLSRTERALFAWGGGVLVQCLVFAPRMFDDLSRGTEYYQLPLVPTAAMLVARGLREIGRWGRRGPLAQIATAGTLTLLAMWEAHAAAKPPTSYATLLADCRQVEEVTEPSDTFVVLADRGGTVLYYCDRRGHTFSLASAVNDTVAETSERAGRVELGQTLESADYLYVPFPELFRDQPEVLAGIAGRWPEVALPGATGRLFARPRRESRPSSR